MENDLPVVDYMSEKELDSTRGIVTRIMCAQLHVDLIVSFLRRRLQIVRNYAIPFRCSTLRSGERRHVGKLRSCIYS